MATVIGRSDSAERALLRRALDDRGFADGADRYGVQLVDDLPPVPHEWAEPDERVLVVSCGRRRDDGVWGLLARGVEDVISWTGEETVGIVLARLERWREVDRLLSSRLVAPLVQGRSSAMRRLLVDLVEQAAYGSGPILLVGETGTGKELAARLVHAVAEDSSSLVVVDCTTIRRVAVEQRAVRSREGRVHRRRSRPRGRVRGSRRRHALPRRDRRAPPRRCRAKLLRALEEGTFKRVGGDTWSRTTFRAGRARPTGTSRARQRAGRFRSDLYHRIASGVVHLPPLRERAEDTRGAVRALPRRGGWPRGGGSRRACCALLRATTGRATCASCGSWRTPSPPARRTRGGQPG